jgi:hypothetical protein
VKIIVIETISEIMKYLWAHFNMSALKSATLLLFTEIMAKIKDPTNMLFSIAPSGIDERNTLIMLVVTAVCFLSTSDIL